MKTKGVIDVNGVAEKASSSMRASIGKESQSSKLDDSITAAPQDRRRGADPLKMLKMKIAPGMSLKTQAKRQNARP